MTTQPVRLQVQVTLMTTAGEADNDGDFDGDRLVTPPATTTLTMYSDS